MSVAKRGLGRGLGALLGESKTATQGSVTIGTTSSSGVSAIRVDAIRPNPRQPRTIFEPEALAELQQSIRELGVLVPIIVRERADGYELIAGERRWRAAAALHLEMIPAIVREIEDRESLEIAVVENVLREDLDPLEEAMGYANLIEEYGYTQERVAERLGKSRPTVTNALRLLTLPDSIKAEVRNGNLSAGHARALLGIPAEDRLATAQRIVAEDLTVRDVERLASAAAAAKRAATEKPASEKKPAVGPSKRDAHIERAESMLRYRLGSQVVIEAAPRGGRIAIRYTDNDDLIRLVELLAPSMD